MGSQAVVYLNGKTTVTKRATVTKLLKRLGSVRFPRMFKPRPNTENDPYLLILLAGQAFDEGREDQAICLIDAAYESFDGRSNVTRFRPVNRGLHIAPGNTAISLSTI